MTSGASDTDGGEPRGDHASADGEATVAKRAVDAPSRRALADEAAVLGRLAHPGVVRLVAHTETGAHAQLLTERVPGPTLAEVPLAAAGAVAAIGAAAATVVADLHALGVAHGSLAPEHMIVSDGRVVLCSFGRAGEATPAAVDRDVADLVVAVTTAARRVEEPASRVGRRQQRRLDDLLVGAATRSLSAAELADAFAALAADSGERNAHATAPTPDGGDEVLTARGRHMGSPSAAEPEPVPTVRRSPARPWRERVARDERPDVDEEQQRRRLRGRGVAAGALAGLLVVAAWAGLSRDRSHTGDAIPVPTPTVASEPTTAPVPTLRPSTPSTPDATDVVVSGNLVRIDDVWFEVGDPGDIVRVGDWDCDGTPNAAVLRPHTGEVFVFDDWAQEGDALRVTALAVHPDAVDIVTSPDRDCETFLAVDPSGNETSVGAQS